ncbi:MAG: sensor histidine kinase [Anaerolineae bacterium]
MHEDTFGNVLLRAAGLMTQAHRELEGLRVLLRRLPSDEHALARALGDGLDRLEGVLRDLISLGAEWPAEPREPSVPSSSVDPAHILREEAERQRLAKALSKGPAQLLANAVVELDSTLPLVEAPAQVREGLRQLRDELEQGLSQLQWLIWELEPPAALQDLGLGAALERLTEQFHRRTRLPVRSAGLERLPEGLPYTVELALLRIVQEALENVHQHAEAREVRVGIAWREEGLELTVEDDGRGFLQRLPVPSLGLVSMQDWADFVGARLRIRSEPGRGTRVTVLLPRDLLEAMGLGLPAP